MANKKKRLEQELALQERMTLERAALRRAEHHKLIRKKYAKAKEAAAASFIGSNATTQYFVEHCLRHSAIRKEMPTLVAALWHLGKYQVRPISDWQPPKQRGARNMARHLLRHLFVAYEMPDFLLNPLFENQSVFIDNEWKTIFEHIAAGKNLRTCTTLNGVSVTKRAAHLFHKAPASLDWRKAISWAQARALGISNRKAHLLAEKRYQNEEPVQEQDWIDLLNCVVNHPELTESHFAKILDFLYHQRKGYYEIQILGSDVKVPALFPNLKLSDLPPHGLLRRINEQEEHIVFIRKNYETTAFPQSAFSGSEIVQGEWTYIIKQLNNLIELTREGRYMRHCVRTYHGECQQGRCVIFTMTRSNGSRTERVGTIELDLTDQLWGVNQFKARLNKRPIPQGFQVLSQWVNQQKVYLFWDGKRY